MSEIEEYIRKTPTSKKLFERACKVFPSGQTRLPYFWKPYPMYVKRARGCRIWDCDNREYIDYCNNMGPLILGHCHPKVMNAVKIKLKTSGVAAHRNWKLNLLKKS